MLLADMTKEISCLDRRMTQSIHLSPQRWSLCSKMKKVCTCLFHTACSMYCVLYVLCALCTVCFMYCVLYALCALCTVCSMYYVLYVLCAFCTVCSVYCLLYVLCALCTVCALIRHCMYMKYYDLF